MCKCNKKPCTKILASFFIIIALVLAVLVSFWRQQTFMITVTVSHFFDIMLPTLAVGALIKYLFMPQAESCVCKSDCDCGCNCDCNSEKTDTCNCTKEKCTTENTPAE